MMNPQQSGMQNPMRNRLKQTRCGMLALAVILPAMGLAGTAQAQTDPNLANKLLIAILVKKGVLSQSDANSIMAQVQAEAAAATAPATAPAAAPVSAVSVTSTTTPDGTIHVTYVPPVVRNQIVSAVTAQMTAQQQAQGYSGYAEVPDWVNHIHFSGDFRFRDEEDLFPHGNANTGAFPNFNAINTGLPFDLSSVSNPTQLYPYQNVDQNRNRFRLRARLGVTADLGEGFTLGLRLATGENDSPVSENQTLGNAANGTQGGNFAKLAIWLDRAYLAYDAPVPGPFSLKLEAGRFDNPFFSTTLIWADDLGFDGVAGMASYKLDNGLTPFITGGAFPVYNTDFNFATDQAAKYPSHNKWLFGVQGGASWSINDDYAAKLGVADYVFTNVAGKLSAPCYTFTAATQCSTDTYRPAFAQNGNTYMALRNLQPILNSSNQIIDQYQYYGLATGYDELAVTGEFDIKNFAPDLIWVNGEYVYNLAFNKTQVAIKAVNNRGSTASTNGTGPYNGGRAGYYANINIGNKVLQQPWDWNVMLGYKYEESDAVIDGFNDSDFGLGGTNLKGYILAGTIALSHNVSMRLHYMSADSIGGPPYKADLFQADLNAKF